MNIKSRVVNWISDHARLTFAGVAAFILVLVMLITIASIANADKSKIYNERLRKLYVTEPLSLKIY